MQAHHRTLRATDQIDHVVQAPTDNIDYRAFFVLANADEEQARRTLQLQILTLERLERDLRVFPTQVSFPAGDGVRPGISANITVTVDSVKGCVAVPVSAVFVEGADRLVYVRGAEGEWEPRKVRLGLSDAGWSQGREGIEPGAVVSLVRPSLVR